MIENSMTQLIDDYLDGELDDAGGEKLRAWLEADTKNVRAFVRQVFLHQQLREGLLAQNVSRSLEAAISTNDEPLVPARAESRTRSMWNYLLSIAAILLIGGLAGSWLTSQFASRDFSKMPMAGNSVAGASDSEIMSIARLTYANGCSWGGDSPQFRTIDSQVRLGDEITLQEGIAEFRLSNGVSISVEGPAALVLASPTSLVLQHGKLTANVPWSVADFRLLAASCRITAREAEFGVDFSGGKVDVHVFSGEVEAASSPFFKRPPSSHFASLMDGDEFADFDPVQIRQDEAVLFAIDESSNELLERRPANRSRFATKLSMSGRLPVSRQYVDSVLASKPVGYWRFESIANGTVRNEIENGPYLRVVDELNLSGDAQNRAVELGLSNGSGHLVSDAPITLDRDEGYSIELWAKPSHFHRGVLLAMTTENRDPNVVQPEKHGMMLELLRSYEAVHGHPGSIRFLHRNPPGIRLGTSVFSDRLYTLRHWQHIVVVKGKSAMLLYIDGTRVAQGKDATTLPVNLHLVIGQTFHMQSVFPFVGQLDELAVYGRALTEAEIKDRNELIRANRSDGTEI